MRIIRTPEQELKDQLRNLKDLCDSYDSGNEAIKTNELNPTDSPLPGSFNLPTPIPTPILHSPNITPHKKTATDITLMQVAFSLSKYAP